MARNARRGLEELKRESGVFVHPGEELLWAGQPDARHAVWKAVPGYLVSIPATAVVGYHLWTAWTGTPSTECFGGSAGGHDFPGLFSDKVFFIPFFAACLAMLGAPWWSLRKAERTFYIVTDARLILAAIGGERVLQSFLLSEIQTLKCRENARGIGDLVFAHEETTDSEGTTHEIDIGFLGIPEVRSVESLVRPLLEPKTRVA